MKPSERLTPDDSFQLGCDVSLKSYHDREWPVSAGQSACSMTVYKQANHFACADAVVDG